MAHELAALRRRPSRAPYGEAHATTRWPGTLEQVTPGDPSDAACSRVPGQSRQGCAIMGESPFDALSVLAQGLLHVGQLLDEPQGVRDPLEAMARVEGGSRLM